MLICGNGPVCGNGPATILIAVEVKSFGDLLQSADSGRLQAEGDGQLTVMLREYQQSWLLWYGAVRCGDAGNLEAPGGRGDNGRTLWRPVTRNGRSDSKPISCEFLDAMLLAIAAMGVLVHHVQSERQAARWLGTLYNYWAKPYSEHKFTHTFSAAPRFPKQIPGVTPQQLERARRLFDRYTGLGMERALAVAKHFGSVQEIANATEKELQEVPGIGKILAAAIAKEFRS